MKKEELYGWVFSYNCYTSKWDATTKDYTFDQRTMVISSSEMSTLEEIIIKHKGNIEEVIRFKNETNG